MTIVFSEPRTLSGKPFARGVGQASDPNITASLIYKATVANVDDARASGLLTPAALQYLKDQEAYSREYVPLCIEELEGVARGFNLEFSALFTYLHLSTLRDMHNAPPSNEEGCSSWATLNGQAGPMLTKNRDFSGTHLDVQRLTYHEGDDLQAGSAIFLGSLGAPGAYSSGMNAAGLAIADTQIGTSQHGVGLLRYFLMTELLRHCFTVDEAIDFINSHQHAGGGSLILADSNSVAAVELGSENLVIERGSAVYRTNHFVSKALSGSTLHRNGYSIDENSTKRFDFLSRRLRLSSWSVADIQRLMAVHEVDGHDAPICQHVDASGSTTLSSVIYQCVTGTVYYHLGNPCLNNWHCVDLALNNK